MTSLELQELGVWIATVLVAAAGLLTARTFHREGSRRAALVALGSTCGAAAGIALLRWAAPAGPGELLAGLVGLAALMLALLLTPLGAPSTASPPPTERVDERDVMFARARYRPGDGRYEAYYAERPERRAEDDETRSLPRIGEPGGAGYDPLNSRIPTALFDWIERVRDSAEGPVAPERVELSPRDLSARLKGMARYLGASDAGITRVDPGHVYSHVGRGSGGWGDAIEAQEHPWALVFTVEMNETMLRATPLQPVIVDSARQYVDAARIALTMAEYLRALGHPARAHVDGNYRLVLPPLAEAAGLGEVGRHSLLITPREGSRVRIGAVTTTRELLADPRRPFGVEDFCSGCRKCETNCPSRAISAGGKEPARGTRYWRIDPTACFRYWRRVGSDCGICVSVCPYSRPAGPLHAFVRLACRRSAVSRRLFTKLDDLFYGRRPRHRRYPEWMRAGVAEEDRQRVGFH